MKQLIFFSANWCSACQAMKPTVEQISKQMGISLNRIDTDYDVSNTDNYGVKSIPTLILLENGKEIKRTVGAQSENQIKSFING
jgi:thioredoxin-like negative regulator of GroEL